MYSTIRFGTASKAAPQRRHLYRAGVGVELAIKRLPARCLDHQATTSLHIMVINISNHIDSQKRNTMLDTGCNRRKAFIHTRDRYWGNSTFFLKFSQIVPIFLDNLKFFRLHFLRKSKSYLRKCNLVFLVSELDSESLSTLREIIFKREASRVEGYVTPSCTRNEAKCQKSEII